jgi:hypothetical protein
VASRAEVLERFFPPPRTEPSWGIKVELFEHLDYDEDREPRIVEIRVDGLAEAPDDWMVVATAENARQMFKAIAPGRFGQPRVDVLRNLTEAERFDF